MPITRATKRVPSNVSAVNPNATGTHGSNRLKQAELLARSSTPDRFIQDARPPELKRRLASMGAFNRLPNEKLELLVDQLGAVGISKDWMGAAEAVARWNEVGDDVLTHISTINKSDPEEASFLRHVNRALSARVDERGAPVRRGGQPLADLLDLRVSRLKPKALETLIAEQQVTGLMSKPNIVAKEFVPQVRLSKAETHEYLMGLAKEDWQFFEDTVSKETDYLPVDNIKKAGDAFTVDYRTSPTNIGLYLNCVIAAKKLGLISETQMLERLGQTTNSVNKLLKSDTTAKPSDGPHLFNWYGISGEPRRLGSFVSSVDNGNFVASIMAVREEVKGLDRTLANELRAMTNSMSMAYFYDAKQGLLRHGADVKKGAVYKTKGTYNLAETEARLALMAGVLENQIPQSTWTNMKPKLGAEFKRGEIELDPEMKMQSWSGTVFESRLPAMFFETAGSPFGAAEEQVLQTHMNDTSGAVKVWGRGEAMTDYVGNGTYAAFGSTNAMSKEFSKDTFNADVTSPYSALMFTDLAPSEVVQNMRNYEKLGARGKYGMYESVTFHPQGKAMVTERFYSHHKGMEMLGMMKELDNFLPPLMHNSALNKGGVIEKLIGTPVSKYRQPARVAAKPQTAQSAYEGSASYNLKDIIGNGSLVAHVASPVGSTTWMNPSYVLSRSDSFTIKDNTTGKLLPFKQEAPSRVLDANGTRTFEYRVPADGGDLLVRLEVSTPSSQTKVSKVSVQNNTGKPQNLSVAGFTRPVLEDPNPVLATPNFRDMFVNTVFDETNGAVIARRRTVPGPKQISQPYFLFSILGEDGRRFDWADGSRKSFMGRDGTAADPAAVKKSAGHKGEFGFTQTPGAALSKSIEVAAGSTQALSFVSAYTSDVTQIPALVGRDSAERTVGPKQSGAADPKAAAIQYPPDSTHELMNAFVAKETFERTVRPTSNAGPKVEPSKRGAFINNGRTFRVTEPRSLPRAWSSVHTNAYFDDEGFHPPTYGNVSTAGGAGYSFGGTQEHGTNAQRLRNTEWDPDSLKEVPRTGVLISDLVRGKTWSIAANPASDPTGKYLFDVSGNESQWVTRDEYGLETTLTKFGAPGDPTELWKVVAENQGTEPRELNFESFVRFAPGQDLPRNDFQTTTTFDAERSAIFADNPTSLKPLISFHSVSGDGTRGVKNNIFSSAENPTSGLSSKVTIAPGEKKEVSFTLGMAESRDQALAVIQKYQDVKQVDAARKLAQDSMNRLLNVWQIETPDAELNTIFNNWLPHQTLNVHIGAKSGLSQSGGAEGGRDQIQSWRNLLVRGDPALNVAARQYLLKHASQQFLEGNMAHWSHPHDGLAQNSMIADTALWGPYAVMEYIKKTGDVGILNAEVPYLDGRPLNPGERDYVQSFKPTLEVETMYQHGKRAIDLILNKRMGAHGLPLMLGGDWNDALNQVGPQGKGESAWLAFFLHDTMTKFAATARTRDDLPTALRYEAAAKDLKANIMEHLWDKKRGFFIRGYADNGEKLDFVDLVVQAWAAESGAVEPEFARRALTTAYEQLYNPETKTIGLLNANFGEEQWDGTLKNSPEWAGGAAEYPPDTRETGQYTHAVMMAASGAAKVGMGDLALKLIRTGLPNVHAQDERYEAEPYAVPADIQTKTRKGGWTQYSGAPGWMMRATLEGALGFEIRDGNKIFVNPAPPKDWASFKASHEVGSSTYLFEVTNPSHVAQGVRSVEVDGVAMDLATYAREGIARTDDGKTHIVKVRMGANSSTEDWLDLHGGTSNGGKA